LVLAPPYAGSGKPRPVVQHVSEPGGKLGGHGEGESDAREHARSGTRWADLLACFAFDGAAERRAS